MGQVGRRPLVTGPDGFTIDLTKCPAGWSDTEGVSDTEIKIGHTTALSGTAADFGNGARAMDVVYRYYSDEGVFTDATTGKTRRVNLIIKDDGYDPARTIPLVDELIDSEKVFAMVDPGLADDAQGLRQAEPALHPPSAGPDRAPGLG